VRAHSSTNGGRWQIHKETKVWLTTPVVLWHGQCAPAPSPAPG
jgi:hypothetical protein